MKIRRPTTLDSRPVVHWLAGHIDSPVQRLRFLRLVMDSRQGWRPPRRSFEAWLLVTCLGTLLLFATSPNAPWTPAVRALRRSVSVASRLRPVAVRVHQAPTIWKVEATDDYETYSNGLRIDNRFSVSTVARSYLAYSAARPDDAHADHRTVPAGIVFHTTESVQAPFEPGHNSALKRIGESLLAWVREKRCYNFLIDRFGRVYRVVQESDVAKHAGNSVWADQDWLYLGLNQSFLGISFETETQPGQTQATVNPAQVQSAAMLTEMLRQRYNISGGNCVTHAQVSVNVSNQLIGYHTDWASSFPFEQLGLPANYALPLPSVAVFGFQYDSSFAHQAGARLYESVQLGEQVLSEHAAAAHVSLPAYRKALQRQYCSHLGPTHGDGRVDGNNDASANTGGDARGDTAVEAAALAQSE